MKALTQTCRLCIVSISLALLLTSMLPGLTTAVLRTALAGALVVVCLTCVRRRDQQAASPAPAAVSQRDPGLNLLLAGSVSGIAVVGADFRFLQVNKSFCDMLGYTLDEVLSRSLMDTSMPEDYLSTIAVCNRFAAVDEPEVCKSDLRFVHKNGSIVTTTTHICVASGPDSSPTRFVFQVADMTEVLQASEAIRLAYRDLEQARESAHAATRAKSQFLANISHEIRTPLNGILGVASLLGETNLTDEQREYTEIIGNCGRSLLSVIRDILDFSKIETGRLTMELLDFDPAGVINEILVEFSGAAAAKGLELTAEIEPALPRSLLGDPVRLRQLLHNLVNNAMKFTHVGYIRIGAKLICEKDLQAHLRFTVEDTGIGIPLSRQALIFESFTQADGSSSRRYGGTGLGLAISRELVRRMDGEIGVDSSEGKGSTFYVEIPFFKPVAAEDEVSTTVDAALDGPEIVNDGEGAPHPADAVHHHLNMKVLIVEDNPTNQRVAQKMVERLGCRATIASNGMEALSILSQQDYDAVLMDIQMPELDGTETTRKIRQRESGTGRRVPVVATTAHSMPGDREMCLSAGMDDYLAKPFSPLELLSVLAGFMPMPQSHAATVVQADIASPSRQTLNWEHLMEACGNDEAFIRELLQEFIKGTAHGLSKLSASLASRDRYHAVMEAHAIKGSCRTVGAEGLAEICGEIELLSGAGRFSVATERLTDATREFQLVRNEIASGDRINIEELVPA